MTEGLASQDQLLFCIFETSFLSSICSVMKITHNVKYANDYVHILHIHFVTTNDDKREMKIFPSKDLLFSCMLRCKGS